jgi:methionyl-tRNA formyltransferase
MGTPEFAVPSLERLVRDGHDIGAVFTQPDKPSGRGKHLQQPPVKAFALERGIAVHQPAKIKTNQEVRAIFESVAADLCVVAAYGKILPEWMLRLPRFGCVNVHASLLPKYRGAAPINWAIANGERETGVTIMQMDAGMDTGDMLRKRAVEIGEDETAVELSARLALVGADLLSETLPVIERAEIEPLPQADAEATYAPMLKREDGLIDWRMTAREIANRVRAFQPWPGCYTFFRGQRLMIWRARPLPESEPRAVDPATVLSVDKTALVIACSGASALAVEELQVEGKRRVTAREFANGMRLATGDRITDAGD